MNCDIRNIASCMNGDCDVGAVGHGSNRINADVALVLVWVYNLMHS